MLARCDAAQFVNGLIKPITSSNSLSFEFCFIIPVTTVMRPIKYDRRIKKTAA